MKSRNWTAIERLPERPDVAIMTGTGYWLNGTFYPTRDRSAERHDRNGHGSREPGPEGVARNLFATVVARVKQAKRMRERWGGGRG